MSDITSYLQQLWIQSDLSEHYPVLHSIQSASKQIIMNKASHLCIPVITKITDTFLLLQTEEIPEEDMFWVDRRPVSIMVFSRFMS